MIWGACSRHAVNDVLKHTITTVGELRDLIAGIPENVPLQVIANSKPQGHISVGYGTDPLNLSRCIVLLNTDIKPTNGARK